MIILDNKFAKAEYHEDGNYILFEYKKFGTSEDFRSAWNKTGDVAIEKHVKKYISDSRKMAVVRVEDQKWYAEEWSVRINKAIPEDTYGAVVLDKGVFSEMSAKSIVSVMGKQDVEGTLKVEYFKDIDASINWIKNVENQLEPLER